MFNLSITTNAGEVFRDFRAGLDSAPRRMQIQVARNLQRAKPRLLAVLAVEPPERTASDHVRWKSRRQQRAFYATNGFGRGIPTFRTHATAHLWDITHLTVKGGGVITLSNSSAYAPYVIGDDQQPFHADLGWKTIDVQAVSIQPATVDVVIDAWAVVSDPYSAAGAAA